MTKPNEKIIGLVFGNLRKLNGDGDLTIIVPIEKVVELIGLPIPRILINHRFLLP